MPAVFQETKDNESKSKANAMRCWWNKNSGTTSNGVWICISLWCLCSILNIFFSKSTKTLLNCFDFHDFVEIFFFFFEKEENCDAPNFFFFAASWLLLFIFFDITSNTKIDNSKTHQSTDIITTCLVHFSLLTI